MLKLCRAFRHDTRPSLSTGAYVTLGLLLRVSDCVPRSDDQSQPRARSSVAAMWLASGVIMACEHIYLTIYYPLGN